MPVYKCEVCGLEYSTAGGLKEHIGCPGPGGKSGLNRPGFNKQGERNKIGEVTEDESRKAFRKGVEGKK